MSRANDLGHWFGGFLASVLTDAQKEKIRAAIAERFGVCCVCEQPLSRKSPGQICKDCHAGQVLAAGLGGGHGGEA